MLKENLIILRNIHGYLQEEIEIRKNKGSFIDIFRINAL